MPKILLFLLAIFLYFSADALKANAGNPSATPVAANTVNLNNLDWEKLFKAKEAVLRKIKIKHVRQERKQHVQYTEQEYQQALGMYRQLRFSQARDIFSNVEDAMADYKSTDSFLKVIYDEDLGRLRRKIRRFKDRQDPQLMVYLAEQASNLYAETVDLGDDKYIAEIRHKIGRLKGIMENLKEAKMKAFQHVSTQDYFQQQFDEISDEADNYDQEVFRLTQSSDLPRAQQKFDEFKQAMIDDLWELKQNMTSGY